MSKEEKDDTNIYGVLGLLFSWIPVLGIAFSVTSIRQAKKFGHDSTLGPISSLNPVIQKHKPELWLAPNTVILRERTVTRESGLP
jgi:hypothetical protein